MDKLKIKAEVKEYIRIHVPPAPNVSRKKKSVSQQEKTSPLIVHQEDKPVPIISLVQ